MQVLILYDIKGFGYHRRAVALSRYQPDDMKVYTAAVSATVSPEQFDVVFLLDYMLAPHWWQRIRGLPESRRPKLVVSFNRDNRSRQAVWNRITNHADLVIVNNYQRWQGDRKDKTICISNGVDSTTFSPCPNGQAENIVLWTGSCNPAKGKRYQEILQPLAEALPSHGFRADFRPLTSAVASTVLSQDMMVEWYRSGSYIVCASQSEGTPNTTLEGMACGLVPISTYVGNLREFGEHGVNCMIAHPNLDDFLACIIEASSRRESMSHAARQTIISGGWDWSERSQYFYATFRRLHETGQVQPFYYRDLAPEDI